MALEKAPVAALALALACSAPREEAPAAPSAPEAPATEVVDDRVPEPEPAPVPDVSKTAPAPKTVAAQEDPAPDAPRPGAPRPWEGAKGVASNAGGYLVQYRTEPPTIPWGEPFELEVWVLPGSGGAQALDDVALTVDAAMPEHGHGMNRVPEVSSAEGGRFQVDGMLLHMPGRWELYFDVGDGALTERAQIEVELE